MEPIGVLLILLSMATGTAALVAIIRPLPRIYLPSRKRAAIVWAISFLALVLGSAMVPTPTPEEQAAQLIAEIKNAQGAEREGKLEQLISINPDTTEFPQEIALIRERKKQEQIEREAAQKAEELRREQERIEREAAQKAEEQQAEANNFVSNGVGKKVPFEMWSILGSPNTLDGTNGKFWVAYLPDVDVSFVSMKASKKVLYVGFGENGASDYLENRDEHIKKGFSAWDGSHRALTRIIEDAMNDPRSYEHAETVYWDMGDHLVVRTTFRGKNHFGGTVKEWVKAKTDLDGNVLEVIEQSP